MNLDGENGAGFDESRETRTSADLERESGGAEEGKLNGVENGLNLLSLDGDKVFSRGRLAGGGGGSVVWLPLSWVNTIERIQPWILSVAETCVASVLSGNGLDRVV
ncbi:hypothetical protein CsSME_00049043 [Camellia sinensis var. sinensis]